MSELLLTIFNKLILLIVLILWLIFSLIFIISVVGIGVMLAEDENCNSIWLNIGEKLMNKLIDD